MISAKNKFIIVSAHTNKMLRFPKLLFSSAPMTLSNLRRMNYFAGLAREHQNEGKLDVINNINSGAVNCAIKAQLIG